MPSLSVQVPERLLQTVKRRASARRRSLDKEVAQLIASGLQQTVGGPETLAELLEPLALMSDDDLWNAARSRMPRRLSSELEKLHQQRQRDGLMNAERDRAKLLTEQFERCLVIRARAIELLHTRGHDVSRLL